MNHPKRGPFSLFQTLAAVSLLACGTSAVVADAGIPASQVKSTATKSPSSADAGPAAKKPAATKPAARADAEPATTKPAASKTGTKTPSKPSSQPVAAKPVAATASHAAPQPSAPLPPPEPPAPPPEPVAPPPQPTAASPRPAAKAVRVPSTDHVRVDVPAGLQHWLDEDDRMIPWLGKALNALDGCYAEILAKNPSASGTVSFNVTMHRTARPSAEVVSIPGPLQSMVLCGTRRLIGVKMPLFTGTEGERYTVAAHFQP